MRLMVAGTHSGCGKTTAALSIMAALRGRGLQVAPLKVGPDYIDTGFHAAACGRPSDNLDTHLCDEATVRSILARGEAASAVAAIEGVMGYYDGMDAISLRCSTYEMARVTRTPVLLVVDAAGGAASVAAMVVGFQNLVPESGIRAVLVNRASSRVHYELVRDAVAHYAGLRCAGYLRKDAALQLPSRHLGLVPACETRELADRIEHAAALAAETVDFDMLLELAADAPALSASTLALPDRRGYRLGVARDEAFGFYYEENLRLLRACGMELAFFSPLRDARLPDGLNGLYIGGGFPEVFAEALESNQSMREDIRMALTGGLRCYAECGGLMYLSKSIDGREMVGHFPIACRLTDRLQRFGYVIVEDESGLTFPAHEFHHAVAEPLSAVHRAFCVRKASAPDRAWACGYELGNALAGFPHLHFGSHPELIGRLWP